MTKGMASGRGRHTEHSSREKDRNGGNNSISQIVILPTRLFRANDENFYTVTYEVEEEVVAE